MCWRPSSYPYVGQGRGFSFFGGGLGSGSSVTTNSSVAEPRFSGGLSWPRTYRPTATAMTIATSPPPTSRRRRVTGRRMANGSRHRAAGQQLPDPLCHLRQLEAERRLVQLAGPLRCAGADHDPATEAECHEGRLTRVAARLGHPAGGLGETGGGLEDREVAQEAGHALEQAEAVLEHGERRRAGGHHLGPLPERVLAPPPGRIADHGALQRHGPPERFGAERRQPAAVRDVVAQPLQELVGEPQLAPREGHARRVAERGPLVTREGEIGGEVVRQLLAVEPAEQRRHLGIEALRPRPVEERP